MDKLSELLKDWNDKPSNPLLRPHRTMSEAEVLIHALQVELAGKESVIEILGRHDDRVNVGQVRARRKSRLNLMKRGE